jgi:hypothetical protein
MHQSSRWSLLKRDLRYLLDNLAKWSIRPISNRFVFTRAAAPLSSRLDRPNGSWKSQRIPDCGQVRLVHTSDSFSESSMRHLCVRHRRLSARGAAAYDCGRAQLQLVLLVYLDEMVPCEPGARRSWANSLRRARPWASRKIVKIRKCRACAKLRWER